MNERNEDWTSFSSRQVIDILIEGTSVLRYWTGSELAGLCTMFGATSTFGSNFGPSRWKIMQGLLDYCIRENRMSDLLKFLFDKKNLMNNDFSGSIEEKQQQYEKIILEGLSAINNILFISNSEILKMGNRYIIRKIGTDIKLETPTINLIDRDYIQRLSKRALVDIENEDFDSALTKSRTLLEEVFCFVIEQNQEIPSNKGDIRKLYGQVKTIYNMHQDKETDNRINNLLSGLEKIITAVSEMRNKSSDSHGVGNRRIGIKDYHARLFVNSATSMAEFILSVSKAKQESLNFQE